ncbi:hypothetical protein WMY93_018557 [Mugilogobius chulae]|uniref:Gap junction alpha-5 protein (Cx40) C-terminal domain-containing protein n=1 Tax=Mugilogobius chulae TaxID=88201 RepID=A0AAW0NKC0_9GOBI
MPFPQHRLANQQNSENMATEKSNMAAAVEEDFVQPSYSPGWHQAGDHRVLDDQSYPRTEANCYNVATRSNHERLLLCPDVATCQKDKRRFSKTSGSSSRSRADDLSV